MPLFDIEDLPEIAPVLTITYPDHLPSSWCQKPDAWYHSDLNSLPLYIDISTNCETGDFNRSRLDIANDLSTVFLIPIPTSTIQYPIDVPKNYLKEYRICNGESVNISENWARDAVESYTSSALCGTSSDYHPSQRPALRVNMTRLAVVSRPSTFCPASGRLVYTLSSANNRTPSGGHIVISDFL